MEENPYQSPTSEPEVEKLPTKPVKPPNRYLLAAVYGLVVFLSFVMLQTVIWEIVWAQTNTVPSLTQKRLMLPSYALLACPLGVLIAWWTLRAPESKWVSAVALLLGLIPRAVAFVAIALFGVE